MLFRHIAFRTFIPGCTFDSYLIPAILIAQHLIALRNLMDAASEGADSPGTSGGSILNMDGDVFREIDEPLTILCPVFPYGSPIHRHLRKILTVKNITPLLLILLYERIEIAI